MGEPTHQGLRARSQVILAREPAFTVGTLRVDPSSRHVGRHGQTEMLEPRVMQVLVALQRARGAVVTRDELIERCWSGRMVGDDALNRVVSRLRHVARGMGQSSFRVETIAKVGHRLVEEPPARASSIRFIPQRAAAFSRRNLMGATAGVAVAAAVGLAFASNPRRLSEPLPEALELYRRGISARQQGWVENGQQAEAYFRQAVLIDPNFAEAWGALALQRVILLDVLGSSTQDDAQRVRSAAVTALSLDPKQHHARLATALLPGLFRRWGPLEHDLRQLLQADPEDHYTLRAMGNLMGQVGQWDDSVHFLAKAVHQDSFAPGAASLLVSALWAAGRGVEAEHLSRDSLIRWPRHHGVWFTRMLLLTYGGQPDAAVAFAQDSQHHPTNVSEMIAVRLRTARAVENGEASERSAIANELFREASREPGAVPAAVRLMTALGDRDRVFGLLDFYFKAAAEPTRSSASTDFLFQPSAQDLWADKRFASLTDRLSLADYWRASGALPGHLKG